MSISQASINLLNETNVNTWLFFIEHEEVNIFSDLNMKIKITNGQNYNYQKKKVESVCRYNNRLIYKIEIAKGKYGYFAPKTSFLILPKKRLQVKINNGEGILNNLNKTLNLDTDYITKNKNKVFYSQYYTIFNDEVYECLTLKNKMIGFIKTSFINNLEKETYSFNIKNQANLYRDSAMLKKFTTANPDSDKLYLSKYIIYEENKIRFSYENRDLWIDINNTSLTLMRPLYKMTSVNETISYSIIYQLNMKLENYHEYYLKAFH